MDPITRLYRACAPDEALEGNDPRWVDCDEARGSRVAPLLARALRRADPGKPEFKLFTGHRGIGKSTELHRLKHLLEEPAKGERKFRVIYMDATRELDIADLDSPDLAVMLAGQVMDHLKDVPGFKPINVFFERFWESLRGALATEIDVKGIEVDAGFIKLTAELKGSPSAREALRREVNKQATTLRRATNDLLEHARDALERTGFAGLVLIVDGLDKLPSDRHERIFCDRCDQLVNYRANIVYTVPISLAYGPRFAETRQTFGEDCVPVPMLRLGSEASQAGFTVMEAMIRRRCEVSTVSFNEVFDDPETLRYLCAMTGGHLRHLFSFLQASLNRVEKLPVRRTDVEQAVRDYADSLAREIPSDYWSWLRSFRASELTRFPAGIPDEVRRNMLHWLYVFEYRNGEPYYDVNPVIRRLSNFGNT